MQMYPIFVQDSRISFSQTPTSDPDITLSTEEWSFEEIWESLNNSAIHLHILCNDPIGEFWKFAQNFIPIQAAGGLVYLENGHLLMIKRKGFWDLPKGKIDPMETPVETAVREVSEECGILTSRLILEQYHRSSFHAYMWKGKPTLKQSFWYTMRCEEPYSLTAQIEEDITDILWADIPTQKRLLKDAWPAIRWVLQSV
jgi:8-oxo-dGTP pyrophosphatase MutT (NUDIX family)